MAADTIHRIYTEEKNKRPILHLAAKSFESFTVQPTLGYYRGRPEKSIVIEIIGAKNRDARAIHLKLDEIIKSIDQAQNEMIDIEHLSDDELQRLADKYQKVREECDNRISRRKKEAPKQS